MKETTYLLVGPATVVAFVFAVTWVVLPAVCRLMGWL